MPLEYPPEAANAPLFAADIVRTAHDVHGADLDYSPASLDAADAILGGFHDQGLDLNEVLDTAFGLGCYLGEVMVRYAKAEWVDFDEERREIFDLPFGVKIGESNYFSPVGKAYKRVLNGPEDSLRALFNVVASGVHLA